MRFPGFPRDCRDSQIPRFSQIREFHVLLTQSATPPACWFSVLVARSTRGPSNLTNTAHLTQLFTAVRQTSTDLSTSQQLLYQRRRPCANHSLRQTSIPHTRFKTNSLSDQNTRNCQTCFSSKSLRPIIRYFISKS